MDFDLSLLDDPNANNTINPVTLLDFENVIDENFINMILDANTFDFNDEFVPGTSVSSYTDSAFTGSPTDSNVSSPILTTETEEPPKCRGCGGTAGKYVYYGGQVCLSCRAFFRRAVQNNGYTLYTCKKNKACEIGSKVKRTCQFCRFQRCQSVGMNPRWVTQETEGVANRRRKMLEKKQKTSLKKLNLEMCFTIEEVACVKAFVQRAEDQMVMDMMRLMRAEKSFLEDLFKAFVWRLAVSAATMKTIEDWERKSFEIVSMQFEEMALVGMEDRKILVEESFPKFFIFTMAKLLNRIDFMWKMRKSASKMEDMSSHELKDLVDQLEAMEMSDNPPGMRISQVYTSSDSGMVEQQSQLIGKIQSWPRQRPDEVLDSLQQTLLFIVIMFDACLPGLRQKKQIEDIQGKYNMFLYRYLKVKYGAKAAMKLGDGLMMSALAKEAYDLHMKMLLV